MSSAPSALLKSLDDTAKGLYEVFRADYAYISELEKLWNPPQAAESAAQYRAINEPSFSEPAQHRSITADSRPFISADDDVLYDLGTPREAPWAIAFTNTFRKSIALADKNLQGRILVALADLSKAPTVSHGDTVKPLSGDLKGRWRYRLGDYRLVYKPQAENRTVMLHDFAARGGVYD